MCILTCVVHAIVCVCVCVVGYSEINSIHNVIYFRIALKTTVQRHISVSLSEQARTCEISIGKNEKRSREIARCSFARCFEMEVQKNMVITTTHNSSSNNNDSNNITCSSRNVCAILLQHTIISAIFFRFLTLAVTSCIDCVLRAYKCYCKPANYSYFQRDIIVCHCFISLSCMPVRRFVVALIIFRSFSTLTNEKKTRPQFSAR